MEANQDLLHLKKLELEALLDLTNAINAQPDPQALYKIFHFTLLANFKVNRLLILKRNDQNHWQESFSFLGAENQENFQDCSKYAGIEKITLINKDKYGFDFVLPVIQDKKPIASVFIRGLSAGKRGIDEQLKFIQTLSNILIVAIQNTEYQAQKLEQELLKKELEIAQKVQSLLFPKALPHTDRLLMEASYLPHQMVGGDYYDVIVLDEDKYLVCIGDVSGKGISAALLMSNVQASLRLLAQNEVKLDQIIEKLNSVVYSNTGGEKFITFFLAKIDLAKNEIEYINAGHNPPLWFDQNEMIWLNRGTTILGVFEHLPSIETQKIKLEAQKSLFMYTDGLTDAFTETGTELLFQQIQKEASVLTPKNLLESTLKFTKKSGELIDDITLMHIQFKS